MTPAAEVTLRVQALLLDLDGTLIDSTPAVRRSWRQWAELEGVDPGRLLGFHGVPAAAIVAAVLPPERRADALARIIEIEVGALEDVVPLPGAVELLESLPRDRWAVVTSGTSALARARIRAAGLPEPPWLVTADDVERGKPDPAPYLLGAERAGVDARDCLVVEDAPSGIASARAAGSAVAAVCTTHTSDELPADLVVPGVADLAVAVVADGLAVSRRP